MNRSRSPSRTLFLCVIVVVTLALQFTAVPVEAKATETKLKASDGSAGYYFGYSVSVDGDTALIGAVAGGGSVYVFVRTGTTWSQQAKLTASDGGPGDNFGNSVSVRGDTAIIGAYFASNPRVYSGAAYIFVRTGTTWSQQAKFTPSDGGGAFGASVSVSGNTAVVGAFVANGLATKSGSAYVFIRTGTTWSQQAKLTASDGASGDYFGSGVSVDGDTAVIGAESASAPALYSGAAYVFVRTGTTWSQQLKLTASDGASGDYFGASVSVDSETAVIGAFGAKGFAPNSGSAYVFMGSRTTWSQQAKLSASGGRANDRFGSSVSLTGDTAVVGAIGLACLFVRTGTTWFQQARLVGDTQYPNYTSFGNSVSVSGDAILIGDEYDSDLGTDAGAAYVFAPLSDLSSPPAPQNLQATPHASWIALSWQAPSSDLSPTTSYRIYRGTVSGNLSILTRFGTGSTELAYNDSPVTNNITYYYQVSAINSFGEGPRSNEVSATAGDTTKPTVTITSPTSGATITSTTVTIFGTASDDVEVQKVELSTNGTKWVLANGTTDWSRTLTLKKGENTLYARATDTSGNNATTTINVTVTTAQTSETPPVAAALLRIFRLAAIVAGGVVITAVVGLVIFLVMRRSKQRGSQKYEAYQQR